MVRLQVIQNTPINPKNTIEHGCQKSQLIFENTKNLISDRQTRNTTISIKRAFTNFRGSSSQQPVVRCQSIRKSSCRNKFFKKKFNKFIKIRKFNLRKTDESTTKSIQQGFIFFRALIEPTTCG